VIETGWARGTIPVVDVDADWLTVTFTLPNGGVVGGFSFPVGLAEYWEAPA
jgi:hypothetical protein